MHFCKHIAKKKISLLCVLLSQVINMHFTSELQLLKNRSLSIYLTAFPFFTPQRANLQLGPVINHPFSRFAHYMHWMYVMRRQRKGFTHPHKQGICIASQTGNQTQSQNSEGCCYLEV